MKAEKLTLRLLESLRLSEVHFHFNDNFGFLKMNPFYWSHITSAIERDCYYNTHTIIYITIIQFKQELKEEGIVRYHITFT